MCQKSSCQVVLKPVAAVAKQLEQAPLTKSSFRLSPFRKVAKSARINLNRYWGILSQSAAMKPMSRTSSSSSETSDFSVEMEQNRINEMLEAQAAAAINDNEWNSEYENSPDFQRRAMIRCESVNSWATSSVASDSRSATFSSDYCYDTISQDSVFL